MVLAGGHKERNMKKAFTVFYDENSGELSSLEMEFTFQKSSPLLRADILLDSIHDLMERYNNTFKEGI